jgi:histidinol-phosphate aminotransferase
MFDINILVRDNVKSLIPYSSARDEFQGKEGIFLDANENPYGSLNRYPDPYQKELKASISKIKDIPEENIFLGNGSDEIIDLSFRTFCCPGRDKALTFTPTYGMYEVSAAVNDVGMIKIPLDKDFQIETEKLIPFLDDPALKLIFICTPNNPTGNSMDDGVIEFIVSRFKSIVLIDEAYNDFSEKKSYKTMVSRYPNLIVIQTFSKSLGLAAARIGIAFTNPSIVQYFNKMKPPYNISTINQKAALKRLTHIEKSRFQVKRIINARESLKENLSKLSIIEKVFPTDANFLLVKVKDPDLIYRTLADNKVIVRNRNKIIPGCIRITVGTGSENKKLIKTLQQIKI